MQTKKSIRFIPLIFAILIVSCTVNKAVSVPTPSTLSVTSLPLSIDSTITPSPIATNTLAPSIDSSCWPVKPLTETNDIKGSFVYLSADLFPNLTVKDQSLLILDTDTIKTRKIDVNYVIHGDGMLFSPDFEKIANRDNKTIFIIAQNKVKTYSLPDGNFLLRDYLNDGRIRLEKIGDNDNNYKEGKGLTLTYYIFDPATGKAQKHIAFLPNYYESDYQEPQFSHDMKYVLYRSLADETEAEFTLFDLEKNEVIWVGPPRDNNLTYLVGSHLEWRPEKKWTYWAPDWTSNTNILTVPFLDKSTGQIKYYSISKEGHLSPITDFDMSDIVDGVWTGAGGSWGVNHPIWSPNDRYLITWGKDKEKSDYELFGNVMYIWDSLEKIVYKPCVPDEELTVISPDITTWYIDGSSFIIHLTFEEGFSATVTHKPNKYFMGRGSVYYFLDLNKKIIYEIPDLNQAGSPTNPSNNTINGLAGWINWKMP